MSLKNLLQRKVISCSPEASIKSLAHLMQSNNVGAVVVVENNKPVGIVTDRDIVLRCVVQDKDCTHQTAKSVMSRSVVTVTTNEGLFDIIRAMKENEIRRIPVVDENEKIIGLLSFGDIFQLLAKEIYDLSAPASPEIRKIVEQVA